MEEVQDIDHKLWVLIRQKEYSAFESLFRKYYKQLCQYAYGMLKNQEQSEDAVQDVFIYLWENRDNLDFHSSVRSYLFTCVRNRALRLLQQKSQEQRHDLRLTEFTEYLMNTEYTWEEEQEIEKIKEVMQELPQQCLKVFLMSSLEGKSYQNIADEMAISINTVKTHVKKAYRIIREKIQADMRLILYVFYFFEKK